MEKKDYLGHFDVSPRRADEMFRDISSLGYLSALSEQVTSELEYALVHGETSEEEAHKLIEDLHDYQRAVHRGIGVALKMQMMELRLRMNRGEVK